VGMEGTGVGRLVGSGEGWVGEGVGELDGG
jgi:hypothetical protein